MITNPTSSEDRGERALGWRARLALIALIIIAVGVVAVTKYLLTDRFTETTRNRAELRLALYSGNILSELRQNAIVPQLLARDPTLITALDSGDFAQSSQRLITFNEDLNAASLILLDADGRIVASTDRARIGESERAAPYFVDTLRQRDNVFTIVPEETGVFRFFYSRRIDSNGALAGMIVVEVDLQKFENAWAGISDALLVTNSEGNIILTTEPQWRGLPVDEALKPNPPNSSILRALQATADWSSVPRDVYLEGEAAMRVDGRVAFQGWRIASFTTYANVRDKVNGVLALEIMVFAILLAAAFYFLNRKTAVRMALFQRESAELRALNARLQREIAERLRVQENLAVAEQTIQQSSKLAVLGEMSAAVSHELNQPLAAMKTYLAGARLLLSRNRPDEALSSFQRIDDLIGRMGAITKQLKSYARQDGRDFQPVNMADAVNSSLALMEPQLRQRKVDITRTLPETGVWVMGDRVRIEQVIINLLRNAVDATQTADEPIIEVLLVAGDTVSLTVRDNGTGIVDIDNLFEPFYTTKQPGDGVGLGLAISSGIVNDLGGRLTARNASAGGAVFEMQLPTMSDDEQPGGTQAAE
ncbi:MAG: ATP-binding protein [Pseudomonadota bacterium]